MSDSTREANKHNNLLDKQVFEVSNNLEKFSNGNNLNVNHLNEKENRHSFYKMDAIENSAEMLVNNCDDEKIATVDTSILNKNIPYTQTNETNCMLNSVFKNLDKMKRTSYVDGLITADAAREETTKHIDNNNAIDGEQRNKIGTDNMHLGENTEKTFISKNESKKQYNKDNILFNTTYAYIKNVVTSQVKNEKNSIYNQNLDNVKSVTIGNMDFSSQAEEKKKKCTYINEKEEKITKEEERVGVGEGGEEEENNKGKDEEKGNSIDENENQRNYKIPFYSWIYTNPLEEDILNNIYQMLNNEIIKSKEQDEEINFIKNEIINLYKKNVLKPITLGYCLSHIKKNKKIIEIMFYLLQNSKVINMMHDPKYNELKVSDRVNMERVINMYKRQNKENQYYDENKKTINEKNKHNNTFKDQNGDMEKRLNKKETQHHDYNLISSEEDYSSSYNSNRTALDVVSKKRKEIENRFDNVQHISKIPNQHNSEIEGDGRKEIEKEKVYEENETDKPKREIEKEKEIEQEKEEEEVCSIYACVSCGEKCQYLYYILKPNKIKNVSFGVLDKCVWCSDCFNSSKYPNVLNRSNFVKVNKPNKTFLFQWTLEEIEKLIEGIEKYKNQWDKISEYVQTKTPHECIYKFLTMPLSDPYFNADKLITTNENAIPLSESNNSLLSLLTYICSYVSPYIGAYAAKKIVDTILDKQKKCIIEMEQKMKVEKKTANNNLENVDTNFSNDMDINKDKNAQSNDNINVKLEEQNISTYILNEQEMKEIHNIVIEASKKRAKELADLEKHNLKKLLKQLVLLHTKKLNLKLEQYQYIQKYLESQNRQMEFFKEDTNNRHKES